MENENETVDTVDDLIRFVETVDYDRIDLARWI